MLDSFAKQSKACIHLLFWRVFLICNLCLFSSAKAYFFYRCGKNALHWELGPSWGKKFLPVSCSFFSINNITAFHVLDPACRAFLSFLLQILLQSVSFSVVVCFAGCSCVFIQPCLVLDLYIIKLSLIHVWTVSCSHLRSYLELWPSELFSRQGCSFVWVFFFFVAN